MSDWTTITISDSIEIDLHPDLDSLPAAIRDSCTQGNVFLSKKEVHKLYEVLKEYFDGGPEVGFRGPAFDEPI